MSKVTIDQPFELEISVQPEDIDELGHVNNVVYLKWVQYAATTHWNTAFPNGHEPSSVVWVVIQHEIRYRQPTLSGRHRHRPHMDRQGQTPVL